MIGPASLSVSQYNVAQKPAFGGELKVYLSAVLPLEVGQFAIEAANSGTFTADPVNVPDETNGNQLIAVCNGPLAGGATNVVLTISGTNTSDAPITATATFKPVAWSQNQTRSFPLGWAVDVVQGSNQKFKTITGVTSVNAAGAAPVTIKFFAMPDVNGTNFALVGCTTDNDYTTKAPAAKPIPCGMNGSAFVKLGRSPAGELNIKAKYISIADGLARFDGIRCLAMAKLVKEGQVETERLFFIGYIPKIKPNHPDGDSESMNDATGFYEDFAAMSATGAS